MTTIALPGGTTRLVVSDAAGLTAYPGGATTIVIPGDFSIDERAAIRAASRSDFPPSGENPFVTQDAVADALWPFTRLLGDVEAGSGTANIATEISAHVRDYSFALVDTGDLAAELCTVTPAGELAPVTGTFVFSHPAGSKVRLLSSVFLNILWFGAQGNSLSFDSAALAAAAQSAHDAGGGVVFVPKPPAGTYAFFANGISWPGKVGLVGEGYASRIHDPVGNKIILNVREVDHVWFDNLRFTGTPVESGWSAGRGAIYCAWLGTGVGNHGARMSLIGRLWIEDVGTCGITLDHCQDVHIGSVLVDNCSEHGLYISHGSRRITIDQYIVKNCGQIGTVGIPFAFKFAGARDIQAGKLIAETAVNGMICDRDIDETPCQDIQIDSMIVRDCETFGVRLNANSTGINIDMLVAEACGLASYKDFGTKDCRIGKGDFYDTGTSGPHVDLATTTERFIGENLTFHTSSGKVLFQRGNGNRFFRTTTRAGCAEGIDVLHGVGTIFDQHTVEDGATGPGIRLREESSFTRILNGTFGSGSTSSSHSVRDEDSDGYNEIAHCYFKNDVAKPVFINAPTVGNHVHHNTFADSLDWGVDAEGDKHYIHHNYVAPSCPNGIYVRSGDGTIVRDNVLTPGTANIILDSGTNTVKLDNHGYTPAGVVLSSSATPSVKKRDQDYYTVVGSTRITNFADGINGQVIYVRGNGNVTIEHNTSIRNRGGEDLTPSNIQIVAYKRIASIWFQI